MCRSFVIGYILEDHLSEITCTVVVCFSAFLLAEATPLRVSHSFCMDGLRMWDGI